MSPFQLTSSGSLHHSPMMSVAMPGRCSMILGIIAAGRMTSVLASVLTGCCTVRPISVMLVALPTLSYMFFMLLLLPSSCRSLLVLLDLEFAESFMLLLTWLLIRLLRWSCSKLPEGSQYLLSLYLNGQHIC